MAEIQELWDALSYKPPKPPTRGTPPPPKPKLQALIPKSQMTRAVCAWVARLDGVSIREVYHEWDWVELWQSVAVHLALIHSQ